MAFIHQGGDIGGQLQQYMRIRSNLNGFYLTANVDGNVTYVVNSSENDSSDAQLWCVQFYGKTFTITCKAQQWAMSSGGGKLNEQVTCTSAPVPPPLALLWTYDGKFIKTAQSSGYVLDIIGSSPNDGTHVQLYSPNGGQNQIFTVEPVPSYMTVTSVTPNLVLQVSTDGDDHDVICSSNTSDHDLWTLQYDWSASDGTFEILSNQLQQVLSYDSNIVVKLQEDNEGKCTKWQTVDNTICTMDIINRCLCINGGASTQVILDSKGSSGTLQFKLDMPC